MESSWNAKHFKEVFLQALLALPRFLKNPIHGMRDLPEWDWPVLIALQAALGLVCGLLAAILSRSLIMIITSIFIAPLSSLAVNFIFSGFFYYTFLFVFRQEVNFKLIFTHLLFASIPVLLCNIVAPLIPPIGFLGVAASALLLYVGFRENVHADEKKLRVLLIGLVVFYLLTVIAQMIRFHHPNSDLKIRATPESIDILEKELQGDR
jgi:hypothetical protein